MSVITSDDTNYDCVVDFNLEPQEELQCANSNMNHRMHHSHLIAAPLSMPLMNSHAHHYMSGQIPPQMMVVGGGPANHPQIPTTPPETPPGSSSSNDSLTPPHFHGIAPHHLVDDKSWNTPYILNNRCNGHEPLDLRPNPMFMQENMHEQQEWFSRKYDPQRNINGISIKSQQNPMQPLISPVQGYIHDTELLSLTVRDLNKKLHTMNKDAQQKLKQRRRTLKNRGYAQSCRYKRQTYRQDLESTNKKLQDENHRLQREFDHLSDQHSRLWSSTEALKKQLDKTRTPLHPQQPSSPRDNFNHQETPSNGGNSDQSFYTI